MRDIEELLQTPELLPAGVECEELDRATYSLRCPGEENATRITDSTDLFEDHFEDHQLFIYDSPAFRRVLSLAEVDGTPSTSFANRNLAADDREGKSQ
jgi:hypothetical protein